MRRNPLLRKPPKAGREHRLGSLTEREVTNLFSAVDPAAKNIYEGVHITPHPIVATAYAMNRRRVAYNDYGLLDVVNPPVLIGFRRMEGEELDADGYVTAKAILDMAEQLEKDGVDEEGLQELTEEGALEDEYSFGDYAWQAQPFEPYFGIQYPGGTFGNKAEYNAFFEAVEAQLAYQSDHRHNEYDLFRHALTLAEEIVPQSRILRDIYEDEIAAIVVLAPYIDGEDSRDEEMMSPPFESLDAFEDMEQPEDFNRQILNDATVIYGRLEDVDSWHGTSLSIAAEALPDILDFERKQDALEAGSVYSAEELEAYAEELEAYAEDDEDY